MDSREEQRVTSMDPSPDANLPDDIKDKILDNLQRLTGVDPEDAVISDVLAASWTDGCMGLADPGYCELLPRETDGYKVTLTALGHDTLYHASQSTVLYAGPEGVQDFVLQDIKQSLSENLDISSDDIFVERVQKAVWLDSCMGIQQERCVPPIGPRAGYKVWILAANQQYIFHADRSGLYFAERQTCASDPACGSPISSPKAVP